MNLLMKKEIMSGLPQQEFCQGLCEDCQKEKLSRVVIESKQINSNPEALSLLHMDPFGPINVLSLTKKKYAGWSYKCAIFDKEEKCTDHSGGLFKVHLVEIPSIQG